MCRIKSNTNCCIVFLQGVGGSIRDQRGGGESGAATDDALHPAEVSAHQGGHLSVEDESR